MNIGEIQENIKNKKYLTNLNKEELQYVQKPIGKAIFKSEINKIEKKYNDKINCKLCGKIYSRSNSHNHKKTKIHKIYENINQKLIKILID